MVHKMTGISPSVAIHIPWDKPEDGDYVAFRQYAQAQGIQFGAVNPNVFQDDENAWQIEDQFMFGPDLLVATVLYEGARSRSLYLPSDTSWRDAWTDELLNGGKWIEAEAPLDRIPLYLRGEAHLPIKESL